MNRLQTVSYLILTALSLYAPALAQSHWYFELRGGMALPQVAQARWPTGSVSTQSAPLARIGFAWQRGPLTLGFGLGYTQVSLSDSLFWTGYRTQYYTLTTLKASYLEIPVTLMATIPLGRDWQLGLGGGLTVGLGLNGTETHRGRAQEVGFSYPYEASGDLYFGSIDPSQRTTRWGSPRTTAALGALVEAQRRLGSVWLLVGAQFAVTIEGLAGRQVNTPGLYIGLRVPLKADE